MATMIGDNIGAFLVGPADLSAELAETCIDIIQRADELAGGADRCLVNDDETAGRATLLVKQIIEATKAATDRQRTAKKPYQELADVAFDFFKPPLKKLADAKQLALSKLDGYRKQQERIAADARRAAEDAARLAQEAQMVADLDTAFELEERAQVAQAVAAAVKPPSEIRSAYGHLATARKSWAFRVVNREMVPRMFLTVNEAAIKAQIAGRTKGRAPEPIAGIEFYEIESTVVR